MAYQSHRSRGRYFDIPSENNRSDDRGVGSQRDRNDYRNNQIDEDGAWWTRSHRRSHNSNQRPRAPKRRHSRTQYDETGVGRKRVKGGRIAKVSKVRSPDPDLFCESCEHYLADQNAKAAHDKSKLHHKKLMEWKAEAKEEELAAELLEEEKNWNYKLQEFQDSLEKNDEQVFKLYQKALHDKRKPVMYVQWCTRSLEQVSKNKGISSDERQRLLRAVHLEIMHFTAHKYDDGTWLLQNWNSLPMATGKRYMDTKIPKPFKELVVPDVQVQAVAEAAPAFLNIPIASTTSNFDLVPEEDNVASVEVDNLNSTPSGNEAVAGKAVEEVPPLLTVTRGWRLSKCAENMAMANHVYHPNAVVSRFASRFSRDCAPKRKNPESHELLTEEFKTLKSQFTSESYGCSMQFDKDVNSLIEKLEKSGKYRREVQMCLEMLVRTAIYTFQFGLLVHPLGRLMEYFGESSFLGPTQEEYVGYWIMSLLMIAGKTSSKEVNVSLENKLSQLPPKFLKVESVKFGLAVLRALVSNNHTAFFRLYSHSSVHLDTEQRSRYIMQLFVPIVRQRALLMFGSPSPIACNLVYQWPNTLPLSWVAKDLHWLQSETGEEEACNVDETRQHAELLGISIRKDSEGTYAVVGSRVSPVVEPHANIDCGTILGFVSSKHLICLK